MFHKITMKSDLVKQEESSARQSEPEHPSPPPQGNSRVFAKMGLWDDREKLIYLSFLQEKRSIFQQSDPNQLKRLFRELAHRLGTRKPNQCKQYHLKMQRYYQSLPSLVHCLQEYLQPEKHEEPSIEEPFQLKNPQPLQPNQLGTELGERPMWSGRRTSKKLSIKLPLEDPEVCLKDEELPKTDQSISLFPQIQTQGNFPQRARSSLPFNFTETLACPSNSPFLLPYSGFPVFGQYNVGEGLLGSETVQGGCVEEWVECHSLFLAWQQRFRKLWLWREQQWK